MAQTPGIISVKWNGALVSLEKGATLKLPGEMKNPVIVGREVNHSAEFKEGRLKGNAVLKRGQKFGDLWQAGEGELQVKLDTGHQFIFPNAVLQERPELTVGEGKIAVEWFFGEGSEKA